MTIELDEKFEWSPTMAARITRPRAVKILSMIAEAREVIIQTHPEPETVRYCYNSEWITEMCRKDPDVIDPRGTLRFLQKIDALFEELGIDDDAPEPIEDDGKTKLNPVPDKIEPPPDNPNDPDNF